VPAYVIRVWLPDRPGALGAVASRIGAVRADVIGIDIIERGAGRAVDDLVIDLPDGDLVDLLLAEIGEVEGVDVEHLRSLDSAPPDPAVTALHCARALHSAVDDEVFEQLVSAALMLLGADWAALVDPTGGRLVAAVGHEVPEESWLCAFVLGMTAEGAPADLADLAVAKLPASGHALVVARADSPLRGREQDVLNALAEMV
jgi:hypothetical protein